MRASCRLSEGSESATSGHALFSSAQRRTWRDCCSCWGHWILVQSQNDLHFLSSKRSGTGRRRREKEGRGSNGSSEWSGDVVGRCGKKRDGLAQTCRCLAAVAQPADVNTQQGRDSRPPAPGGLGGSQKARATLGGGPWGQSQHEGGFLCRRQCLACRRRAIEYVKWWLGVHHQAVMALERPLQIAETEARPPVFCCEVGAWSGMLLCGW